MILIGKSPGDLILRRRNRLQTILDVVAVGQDGTLWHTIRRASGNWYTPFSLLENQSLGGPSGFLDAACGSPDGGTFHVVGLGTDGQLWHTVRPQSWIWQDYFGLVEGVVSGGPPGFKAVSCSGAGGHLHVVAVGTDGRLWHTLRNGDGSWQSFFGLIESQVAGGPSSFVDVDCASSDGYALQIVGVGQDGQLWHTIRLNDGTWQNFFGLIEGQSSGGPPGFAAVGASGEIVVVGQNYVGPGKLHLVGVSTAPIFQGDGKLWHTIRNANASWQNQFGLIEAQSAGGSLSYIDVDCGTSSEQILHVIAAGIDGLLWHTIRLSETSWQTTFGLVEGQVSGGQPFKRVSCWAWTDPQPRPHEDPEWDGDDEHEDEVDEEHEDEYEIEDEQDEEEEDDHE